MAKEIENKIYEALGIEPAGGVPLAAVEPPDNAADVDGADGDGAQAGVATDGADRAGGGRGSREAGRVARRPSRLMEDWTHEGGVGEPPRSHSEVEPEAIDLAYRAVARRERTVAELRTCLERKRVEPLAIDVAVEELTEAGYLDDARYARRFAEDKRELEQWNERIARDLQRRGVAPDLIEDAVLDSTRRAEFETALLLLERRFPDPRDDRDRERAWRMLVRRG